ncbi:ResA-like WAxxUGC motif-containing protein [Frankia sp. QA3]|uniref:ResA-like WAxxUGC motif-containing protein n=1 Tax=Frankia sp. QA3 TaxID=710111 RepID=UPI000269CE5D|nr:ResA-like WAxxUGC motif-containing protein [Frankia sp. QA3]EIV96200.1 Peroxiredoxin [Frankia sp. QA3]
MILDDLTVDPAGFQAGTGWAIKPQGACKGDVCVPLPGSVRRPDGRLDVTGLAERLGMGLVADEAHGVWALGPESAVTGRALTTAQAPPLELPRLDGTPFRLDSLRGQKVVLVAWASWCGCREDLRLWSALREQLHPLGLEVVTVALDTGGPDAARPWIEKAGPKHPALIDARHELGAKFGVVNVPNGLWIDEDGVIVRPAEPAWIEDPHASSEVAAQSLDELPADHRDVRAEIAKMAIDPAVYPAMIRDWVTNGRASRYALEPHEVLERARPRDGAASQAAARFELGEHLHRAGDHAAAVAHWREAHRLQPDNWTYKRQAWNLADPESVRTIDAYGTGWLDDVRALGAENYYPEIKP